MRKLWKERRQGTVAGPWRLELAPRDQVAGQQRGHARAGSCCEMDRMKRNEHTEIDAYLESEIY